MTLSAMRLLIQIKLLTNYLQATPEDSHVKQEIKKALKMDLENHYQDPKVEVLNKVCFLDP